MPDTSSINNTPVIPKRIPSVTPLVSKSSNLPRLDVPVSLRPFTVRDHAAGEVSFFALKGSAQPRVTVAPTTRSAS